MWKFQLFATTLIVLLALFIPDFWREWGELPFLISGFLTVGLLHGSADLLLIRQFGMAENGRSTAYWLAAYLGLIGFVAILLLIAPQVALIGFLIISMFHFGESQFWGPRLARSRSLQLERHALQWIWGAWVILAPIVMHPKESIGVLRSLGEFPDVIRVLEYIQVAPGRPILAGALLWACSIIALLWCYRFRKMVSTARLLEELLCIGLMHGVYTVTSLLTSFGIYFVIWHSITSLRDQIRALDQLPDLRGDGSVATEPRSRLYIRSAAPYWAISVAGVLMVMFVELAPFAAVTRAAVIFAAAILLTPPHAMVLSFLNTRISE